MRYVLPVMLAYSLAAAQGALMDAVQEKLDEVRDVATQAYEDLLAGNPTAAGTMTVTFSISRDGFVGDVSVASDSVLFPVADAVRSAVSELKFDAMAGTEPVQISVPFEFRPPE